MDEGLLAGRYRLGTRVGSGGMADVFRATDEVLERTVAVKLMHPQLAADPVFAERFRREAKAAAELQSPYVITVHDWGQEGDRYFIVMEFIDGEDLESLIRRVGPLPSRQVASIGVQVSEALTQAHAHGIVHRDISSHNILVTPDASVKVTDFGIARVGSTALTQTGSVLGNAGYLSPEQAQGHAIGPASDIYSLGVVLFEAATAQLPFQGDSSISTAYMHVNSPTPSARDANPRMDPRLDAIIAKATSKQPEDRYTTAAEMRDALLPLTVSSEGDAYSAEPVAGALPGREAKTAVMPAAAGPAVTEPIPGRRKRRHVPLWLLLPLLVIALGAAATLLMPLGARTAVPAVQGMTLEQARAALEEDGFSIGQVERVPDPKAPKGTVLSQDPAAGSNVRPDEVDLRVSDGPKMVEVPEIERASESQAVRSLEQAGLVPERTGTAYSSEISEGLVLSQKPAGGEKVAEGSTVGYSLSLGPAPDISDDGPANKGSDKGVDKGRGKPEKDD